MRATKLCSITHLAIALLVLGADRAVAQAPLDPAQLPSRTTFYLLWRGAPPAEARKANALLGLWDDPDFAPLRSALVESMLSSSDKNKSKPSLTRQELEDYSSLLDNPFLLGYLSEPHAHRAATSDSSASTSKEHPWNGMFFVYDRTGKEALLAKAILRLRSQEKDAPQISQLSLSGVPALKIDRKSGVTYWADTGKFAVSANESSVFEEILARVSGKSPAPSSLTQSPAYQEAKSLLGSGMLEFFLRVAPLKDLAKDFSASGVRLTPILDALKLETVHSVAGHISLEGAKTRVRAAILGDAAPGTLFDIWGDGQQSPASLALLPAGAIYYSETQLNLSGIYDTIKRAVTSTLPQGQQGNVMIMEGLAQSRLGMPLPDALALTTGELSSMQTSPVMDPATHIFFLGIRKKPETLKLIRSILGERLTSERNEGDTTFLKISLHGGQGQSGVAQWSFYHLALTPDLLLASSGSESLRAILAQRAASPDAGKLAASAPFQAARSQFPEKLNGFSYFDFQKLDWQALKDKWIADAKTAAEKQHAADNSKSDVTSPDWFLRANPAVFPRHLHSTTSASWKDAQGLHFEQWLE